jgi:subtilisin-like proprotein convertase family protein
MRRFLLFLSLFLSFTSRSFSQPYFLRYDSIPVKINSSFITNPWAGGLNFMQPSAIDLNMDGIKDLFTFDRTGNKVRTFINKGNPNTVDYVYDGSYENKFPELKDWALLADYNNDGKEDIFAYTKIQGGIDIYKNISTVAGGLAFQLVALQQKSVFNPSRFNTSVASIPDGGVSSSWDGVSGAGTFASRTINVSNLITSNWHLTSVCLTINHPNDDDLIVYLVNSCGNKIRLIKNSGGSGDNFINTCFEPIGSNIIGSTGNNNPPFSGTYAPEAGKAAWLAFLSCPDPNGTWSLNVGDQTFGNIGTLNNWALTLYSPTIASPNNLVNLFVSSSDIPAISDIDNDGDLDVVTFSSFGTYMEYHQNMSREFYGHSDSLIFMMKNRCWGYAEEDGSTNNYYLNITCPSNVADPGIIENPSNDERGLRHSGSCQLCIDLDNDGDKEFIVGDISFNNLTMLTNGGTPLAANMVAVDMDFPANNFSTSAVDLSIFPCAQYLDVNNNGLKDLLVCPNAPNVSENFQSVVLYDNIGTNEFPVFQYEQSDLLQNNMIDVGEGAYPIFFDYDNDGLKDLFIGNYGYYNTPPNYSRQIAQFKNTGTASNPKFELITRDYNNLSTFNISNMIPAFGDLDGDADDDLIIGGSDGHLNYFENTAATGAAANFVLTQPNFRNSNGRIIDVGDFAAPQIVDVDNDGKNDLVIGGGNGKIAYYHHAANASTPSVDSVTHFWGKLKVNQPGYFSGYSYPFVFKQLGVTKLLSGSQLGYLRLYDNIDGNLTGTFTLVDSTFLNIREGERTAPSGYDINNDGYLDLVIGNYQGGVAFYKGVNSLNNVNNLQHSNHWNLELFPNPANTFITVQIINDIFSSYQVELINVLGQNIYFQKSPATKINIDTEVLKNGVYVCKVTEINSEGKKAGTLLKKIIIQH